MSQHFFNTVSQGHPARVTVGWDRPLQYYFLTVQALDADEDMEGVSYMYSNLDDPAVPGVDLQLDYFIERLAMLEILVPANLIENVREERRLNVGSKEVAYQSNGLFRVVTR